MMLCKADFEDLFPDLFGPEAPKGSNWHPARNGLSGCRGSHPLSAAQERVIANVGTNLEPASMPKTQ
jgi:hypothetical protein